MRAATVLLRRYRPLILGLLLVGFLGRSIARAWPEAVDPPPPGPGDRLLVTVDAPAVARWAAAESGRSIVTRAAVERYRSLLQDLHARCRGVEEASLIAIVDSLRDAVRGKTGRYAHASAISDIAVTVELEGDHDCAAAAGLVADRYEEVVYDSGRSTEWRSSERRDAH